MRAVQLDVVERCARINEDLDDAVMTKVGRCNERRAIIAAGDGSCIAAKLESEFDHAHVVFDGGDRNHIVAVVLQRVDVATAVNKDVHGVVVGTEGREVKRSSAGRIARVGVQPLGDQRADVGCIASRCSLVQPRVAFPLGCTRRRLRESAVWQCKKRGDKQAR